MKNLKSFLIAILSLSILVSSVFSASLFTVNATTNNDSNSSSNISTKIDISQASGWSYGTYWSKDGSKTEYKTTRASLNKSVSVEEGSIVVFNTGNADFKLIVRCMNSSTNSLVMDLGAVDNNVEYTIPSGCDSLKISIYKATDESSMDVLGFYFAFADGTVKPYIIVSEAQPVATSTPVPTATNTPVPTATNTPVPTATNTPVPTNTSTPTPTATSTPSPTPTAFDYSTCETLDDLYLAMLENGETKTVDIRRFKATYNDLYEAWNRVINGEGQLAYQCTNNVYTNSKKFGTYYITTSLMSMDEGFAERYKVAKHTVNEALSLIEDGMSEVEKALILHEFLMDKATYVKGAEGCYKAYGILVNGKGVCMSYSFSYTILLNAAGLETSNSISTDMNHMWSQVKIDGNWYQVDATWDDTRASSTGSHYYFLRTDNEFENLLSSKHYNYKTYNKATQLISCEDTRFTNWFVHNVKGKMVYSDGYWYYANGKLLMKAHIDGSDLQVVASENAAVTVVKAADGVVTYKVSGTTKTTTK